MKIDLSRVKEVILSIIAGMIVGIIFKVLDFPLPAPPSIPAFMGIFGVWLGASVMKKLQKNKG
ncbi:XapX domain-containing protein [Caldisalinibacter kiritimatiensis]|uniref:XapX domain protein n=1 Tax=Caldisalinibacter kiritimatiensis TaxID=1304284 RepID=R1AWV3_9FIRM|nr:DUF1427 family protein [Caldisalinibacter kiritimatiensis]EOD01678.1 hypothetical protein L21TH_0219 [Caldisalinibacter kiritimatiensis]